MTLSLSAREYGRVFWRVRQHFPDGNRSAWSEARQFTYYPTVIARLLHTKRLRIGIESTRHEGIFASFKDKEFSGIDIELIRIIARLNERYRYDIAKDPEIVQQPWGELLFNLPNTGEADLIISAITKTPEREQKYRIRFSNGYYTSLQTITVLSERGINSVQDLAGKKLGAEDETTNLAMARAITQPDLVKVFTGTDTTTQMFRALLEGEIDGICLDTHLALTQLIQLGQERKFRLFRLTPDKIPSVYVGPKMEEYALAVRATEGDLLAQINPIIEEAKASGFMARLLSRFLPRPLQIEER
jgi:ABC-type amino acid transport substrate-binding protein